tara:strand:- start:683 stop:1009 length:327 start_codon:yes stop_codon:yes gene_type:complete
MILVESPGGQFAIGEKNGLYMNFHNNLKKRYPNLLNIRGANSLTKAMLKFNIKDLQRITKSRKRNKGGIITEFLNTPYRSQKKCWKAEEYNCMCEALENLRKVAFPNN